ncbi:MFS transporter [Wolinella succinogenes]|uniref:PUTATIVE MFS TRANSPORTER n=1 Tax=Wolinella succinogenes (strain ATCC 29543 / DSM 1740 / CCUG 13145 / JCM 31913 / LMG 7466 / NCTC 11488 / FDC 602W) TaxID=273121 RepID=Q7MA90_WOLSU|nr:MFS transporter [Wolinella succinogenes]CAE09548.1 PUTATIVE MFS TRANSPORTER [Wolinella succinogenes]
MPREDSLREKLDFWRILSARALSMFCYQMLSVAVGWQVYSLTGEVFDLGLVGLAQFLPMFLLTLLVGQVADWYDRRVIVALAQALQAMGVLLLAWGSLGGWLDLYHILGILLLLSSVRAFEGPSIQALLPNLVSKEFFPKAVAWMASCTQSAVIIGPALGGVLYVWGAQSVYGTVSALMVVASLLVVGVRRTHEIASRQKMSKESLLAGIAFIRSRPAMMGAISLDLFAVLLGGATAMLPVYAKDILETDTVGLGLLRAAPAIGALLVSLYLARFPLQGGVGRKMFRAVMIFGLATIGFALSTHFWLSMGMLVVLGGSDVVSVVIRSSLVQLSTPDEMRGRVSAVNSMFIGASNQLGEFESGMAAALLGVVPSVVLGGVGTILVALWWMRLFPELSRIERLKDLEPTPSSSAPLG